MTNAFYIDLEGETQGKIDGDVEQEGRENLIRGYSFENKTNIPRHPDTGQPTGTRTHHPIVFTKHVDKSSPQLWMALTRGERLNNVRFDFYKINTAGENENFYSITLVDAVIVEMETDLSDTNSATGLQAEEVLERVHLTYRRIEWEHKVGGTAAADDWNAA